MCANLSQPFRSFHHLHVLHEECERQSTRKIQILNRLQSHV
uniref:Uncharacterized protein n=1 Tax=Anguilla anguilla TaxID=7936 RepID=A0A0E9VNT4_ANGAN